MTAVQKTIGFLHEQIHHTIASRYFRRLDTALFQFTVPCCFSSVALARLIRRSASTFSRKCIVGNKFKILSQSLILQHEEFIHQGDIVPSISNSSSNSSLSSASAEMIPLRTRSFMVAIKSTFERLKETSS